MKALWIVALLTLSGVAFADNDEDSDSDTGPEGCSHPHFVTYDCLDTYDFDGEDGTDGIDGVDGVDGSRGDVGLRGETGPAGADGVAGADGRMGPSGPPGVVPTAWYNDIRGHFAATAAAQVHLPQNKNSRLTLGTARVMGRTGIGIGYAYRASDEGSTAFTLALGRSNSAKVVQLGVSVEF